MMLGEVSANKADCGLVDIQVGESSNEAALAWKQAAATSVEEDDVVGFTDEIEDIANLLIKGENKGRPVVSIVGMGGSESALKQVSKLLEDNKKKLASMDEGETVSKVYDYLKERKYLVVVGDIWKERDWDRLSLALPGVEYGKGSRVLLTTRNAEVALRADQSIEPYELRPLNDDESWELFNKKVRCKKTDLEKLGKEIVAKCYGLPLAILVLGGLLSTRDNTDTAWSKVRDSAKWQLSQGSKEISSGVLALSYIDLPLYLKSCFLYLGVFPEDYEIEAENVIWLWVAEGFLQERGEETLEDVAEDYLQELIHRSMIQVAKRRFNGQVLSCRLHDLLREFAIVEAKQDKFFSIWSESGSVPSSFRRLVTHPNITRGMYDTSNLNWNLRSLLSFENLDILPCVISLESLQSLGSLPISRSISLKSIYGNSIKMIRVLDLRNISITDSVKELGELILLKYLAFDCTTVPPSIVNLCNLQTLLLTSRFCKIFIANSIWKLCQLRHLEATGATQMGIQSRPPQIAYLRDLQTIRLPAGNWIEGGIDKLTNLRTLIIFGRLEMMYIKALQNSLQNLCKLRVVELDGEGGVLDISSLSNIPILSDHVHLYKLVLWGRLEKHLHLSDFPPNLTELRLSRSSLNQQQDDGEPSIIATLEQLPKLKVLSLEWNAYMGKAMTCSTGGFPNLKVLQVGWLFELEEWTVEEGALPNLWDLEIKCCRKLKMLPDGLRNLQKINLWLISQELGDRLKENAGEEWHKIKDIPSVGIFIDPEI